MSWTQKVLAEVPFVDGTKPFDEVELLQLEMARYLENRPGLLEFLARLSNLLEAKATAEANKHFRTGASKEQTLAVTQTIRDIQRLIEGAIPKDHLGGFHASRREHARKHHSG